MEQQDIKDIQDSSSFVSDEAQSGDIIKVIGIGGGGGNAVNYMFNQNIPHIQFVVCNTDQQALNLSPVPNRLLLGYNITHGLGAGNVPDVGRQCAEASEEEIRNLFDDQTEMVFITATMGGGTGTGAAPVVARIAKDAGMLTIGIVTVPFLFEGEKKILKALEGAKELQKHVDALLIINNENLIELYKDLNFFNAFAKADDTLANAARSISEIISESCYINVDFQDVKTTLKDSGSAIIATAIGEGKNRISNAIQNALHSPLLKAHDINTSKRLLFKFMCAKDSDNPIRAEEITEITSFTSRLSGIDVKWGIGDDPSLGDKVKITVLASGFDVTITDGDKDDKNNPKPIVLTNDNPDIEIKNTAESAPNRSEIEKIYGEDKMKKQQQLAARLKYAVLKPSQFDDHEVIALLERLPIHKRPANFNEELENISDHYAQPNFNNNTENQNSNTRQITFG